MFNLGPMELAVIAVVALVVLGPQRLPQAMRQAGKAVSEVRRWSSEVQTQVRSAIDVDPAPPSGPTAGVGADVAVGTPAPAGLAAAENGA